MHRFKQIWILMYKWALPLKASLFMDYIFEFLGSKCAQQYKKNYYIEIRFYNDIIIFRHKINPTLTQNFLGNAYQLNENARAMSIILPISFAHSAIFLLFLSFTIISRIFFQNGDPIIFKFTIEFSNTV